jgi:hypothetical protein
MASQKKFHANVEAPGGMKISCSYSESQFTLPLDGGRCEKNEIFPLSLPSPTRRRGEIF